MIWGEGRHDQVLEELDEWWQDLWNEHTGSRVVLLAVPPGWGRITVLQRFRQAAENPAGPVGMVAWIDGQQGSQSRSDVTTAGLPADIGRDMPGTPIQVIKIPGRWGRRAVAVLVGTGALVLVLGIDSALGGNGRLDRQRTAGQVILQKLVGQEDFLAATATYEVHVVIQDHSILHSFLGSTADSTSVLQGIGTDSALVNFRSLTGPDVVKNGDSIHIFLPRPIIARPQLDPAKLSVTSRGGILYRLSEVIAQKPSVEQHLLVLADSNIRTQAEQGALTAAAEQNTRFFLRGFLAQYNFHHVVIDFVK